MPIETVWVRADEAARIVDSEEGHFSHVKAIEIGGAKVTQTVSAFANASGGELWIGIDKRLGSNGPERVWRGFADVEAANGLIQALEGMAPLGNHYTFEFLACIGQQGLLAHITVCKTREILQASNGKVYVVAEHKSFP